MREMILSRLKQAGLSMSQVSVLMGRNSSYLQQFLKRGIPEELGEEERASLAQGNKGEEAMDVALEMADLLAKLK